MSMNRASEAAERVIFEDGYELYAPSRFYNPISLGLIRIPVTATDGKVYDGWDIATLLKNNKALGPLTNQPLEKILIFSDAIYHELRDFCAEQLRRDKEMLVEKQQYQSLTLLQNYNTGFKQNDPQITELIDLCATFHIKLCGLNVLPKPIAASSSAHFAHEPQPPQPYGIMAEVPLVVHQEGRELQEPPRNCCHYVYGNYPEENMESLGKLSTYFRDCSIAIAGSGGLTSCIASCATQTPPPVFFINVAIGLSPGVTLAAAGAAVGTIGYHRFFKIRRQQIPNENNEAPPPLLPRNGP